jgi:chromosome segregation protein
MEELSEADGRFTFLDEQRKDLQRARLSLSETLATINEESVRLFLSTFEEVRGHFQQLFRQLFGGGKADLELQQGVDPLEAGIEISARPPGREMLPIGLLSGGQRTMTALALLFAVFQARPSPFCILDEVDAALDDANVGRFLGMLDTFRRDTQFVIVTHNKGSMAACDGLYGITMEVKGVSRYVAVEFGEVELIAPHATGNTDLASRSRVEVRSRGRAPSSEEGSEQRFSSDGSGDDEADGEREVVLEVQARASQGSSVADKLLATTPEQ